MKEPTRGVDRLLPRTGTQHDDAINTAPMHIRPIGIPPECIRINYGEYVLGADCALIKCM